MRIRAGVAALLLAAVLAVSLASPLSAGKKRPHPSKLKYPPIEITTPDLSGFRLNQSIVSVISSGHILFFTKTLL